VKYPKRDDEFKGLMEGVIDSLNKGVQEHEEFWEQNVDKIRESNLREFKRERQRKLYMVVISVISIVIISTFIYFYNS
jgi:t-SNARE complex subunit (syntaxin)